MSPGKESVDEYLNAHYPPWKSELEAYQSDLLAKVQGLEEHIVEHGQLWVRKDDVLDLIEGKR